ncbi:MAG: TetR/AcrR family transcriptional regulator [Ketobacter sp.]|uniref:TetR/AcrR family transcriptional regulator n=1 Tax=unclassified Ketobacter TaxID=2639109 RepID=UPI0025C71384|nr:MULTISPECIES: TetR/AcrR family transcriptional regulator [unclassified Ketobacter]MEC8812035.1 TetR family transcriptional regulator [Pseudomonadota bacterium]
MNLEIPAALLKEDEDSTNQRILDSARSLYIEYGLRRTTMEDVSKRAGMGRATLYRRFSEKDQLFKAVIFRDLQRSLVHIEEAINDLGSALDALLESFVLFSRMTHGNELLQRLLKSEPDHVLPYLTTDFELIMSFSRQYLAMQLERAQKAGHIRAGDPQVMAEMVLRLTQSLMLSPSGVINPADEDSLRAFTEHYLRPLLAP